MNSTKFKFLTILLFLCLSASTGYSEVGEWTTFTSQNDIRDILLTGDYIWCASNGGVFRYQISTEEYRLFHNTNGLTSIDAQTIEVDHKGNIWIGFADGWINCFDVQTEQWKSIDDFQVEGYSINDIEAIGDSLLIATKIGVSLYDITRQEVKETYKNLGFKQSNGDPLNVSVIDIHIDGREIWLATDAPGVANSSFELSNLMAPDSWTSYSKSNGFTCDNIYTVTTHHDSVFAGTDDGVFYLDNGTWVSFKTGLDDTEIKKVISKDGTLYAAGLSYISYWRSFENRWRNIAYFKPLSKFTIDDYGNIWAGHIKNDVARGFGFFSRETREWQLMCPPGPASNEINSLAIDQDGILWCASNNDGILRYDGTEWTQITTEQGLINNGIKVVTVDSDNNKWFGSFGGGLILIDKNDSVTVFHNDKLSGINSNSSYVLITDINVDRLGNVWMLNSEASNNNAVATITNQSSWYYFATQDGLLSNVVTSLDFNSNDWVWVGTQVGVSVINYNNTLADKSDDNIAGNNLTTRDGLSSNSIKDIAVDYDDIVWIGTENKVHYWVNGEVKTQAGLISNSVNVIEVDIRNNKWFGTSSGISVLGSDGYTITNYTTDDSPLVSDNIRCFGFDYETGKVYIGTTSGLSCLETPYSRPRENLDQVTAGPNPFLSSVDLNFSIFNLADDVSVKFFTENGRQVRVIKKDEILGSQALWDGKDDNGNSVASGIYIYIIYNEETGENTVGKLAVIR